MDKKIPEKVKHSPVSKKNIHSIVHSQKNKAPKKEKYKEGLLEVDKQEERYNRLFEQKLSEQYKEFRNIKDHHIQIKKFIRVLIVLITIILIALFVMSFK
jgi:esterase/lipase